MKKNVFLLLIGVVLVYIGVAIGKTSNNEDIIKDDTEASVIKHENSLSMMLETEANSGNYEMTTRDSWPTEGYIFNSELSKCENGGELSWDNEKKVVLMSGNVSDKCYVYFDIISTIIFKIKNKTYYAKPGMTWEEWINSEYNVDGYEFRGRKGVYITGGILSTDSSISDSDCNVISDITVSIVENYSYKEVNAQSSNGDTKTCYS